MPTHIPTDVFLTSWSSKGIGNKPWHVLQLTAGAFATAGLRGEDRMEDRHVIKEGLAGCSSCHLLAVFDGHRGSEAAQYAAQHIVQQLQETMAASDPAKALADTLVSLDILFRYASVRVYENVRIRHATAHSQVLSLQFQCLLYSASLMHCCFACAEIQTPNHICFVRVCCYCGLSYADSLLYAS